MKRSADIVILACLLILLFWLYRPGYKKIETPPVVPQEPAAVQAPVPEKKSEPEPLEEWRQILRIPGNADRNFILTSWDVIGNSARALKLTGNPGEFRSESSEIKYFNTDRGYACFYSFQNTVNFMLRLYPYPDDLAAWKMLEFRYREYIAVYKSGPWYLLIQCAGPSILSFATQTGANRLFEILEKTGGFKVVWKNPVFNLINTSQTLPDMSEYLFNASETPEQLEMIYDTGMMNKYGMNSMSGVFSDKQFLNDFGAEQGAAASYGINGKKCLMLVCLDIPSSEKAREYMEHSFQGDEPDYAAVYQNGSRYILIWFDPYIEITVLNKALSQYSKRLGLQAIWQNPLTGGYEMLNKRYAGELKSMKRPVIQSITPNPGIPLSIATVYGQNFLPGTLNNDVYFNNQNVVVQASNPESLEVVIPPNFRGGYVTVKCNDLVSKPFKYDAANSSVVKTITYGDTIRGEITKAGLYDTYTFTGSEGDVIIIALNRVANKGDGSGTYNPIMQLSDDTGNSAAFDNDSGSDVPPGPGRNALIKDFVLPRSGTYTITVDASSGMEKMEELYTVKGKEMQLNFNKIWGTGPYELSLTKKQ